MTKRELRIVNPNTDPSVTRWLREEASRVAGDAFEVVAVNADSGLPAIQTPAEIEFAARAVLSAISAAPRPWGAVVAAFGDPGLSEARALGSTAVVGLGECGLLAAGLGGRRFSIVTLGAAMRETILAKVTSLGLSGQLAGVRFLPFSIAELKSCPIRSQITHLACEEGWSYIAEWIGVPLSHVLEAVGIHPQAKYVVYFSMDPEWWDSIDMADALHPQTFLALGMNGGELPVGNGGPLRMRVPRQLGYKSVKFITRLTVTDDLKKFGKGLGSAAPEAGYAWYAGI